MPHTRKPISVLIVDDEEEACINLKNILSEYIDEQVHVVGTAHNTLDAERLIEKFSPDAVLLDIEMPKENAFTFLERISPVNFQVVFVTAYDEYAIRAFKMNAVDYILKPISIPELKEAMKKLKEKIQIRSVFKGLDYDGLSNEVSSKAKSHKITLKDNNVVEVVDFKDIFFIEAQGSYFKVVFVKDHVVKEIVMCGTLTEYEELLPPELFFRIHKSYLINCLHVKNLIKDEHSEVVIKDVFTLPVSRRRYAPLIEFLKNNHDYNE